MIKRLTVITVFVILILSISYVMVAAASETKDLFTLDSAYNMTISILFDKEMPNVSFTAPDGTVYEGSSLSSDSGDNWVQYYIPNAMPGTWKISYDKLSNTQFEVYYSSYMNAISISKFTVGSVDEGYIPVQFLVESEGTGMYEYQIFAVITDENGSILGEKLLMEGSADLGEIAERDVNVRDLQDHADYKLRLDVWQREGVEETHDSSLSENSFSISGNAYYDPIEDFRTEVNLTEGVITVDWEEWADYGFDYVIAVFDEAVSATEPVYFREITDGETHCSAHFDPSVTDSLRVDITMRRNNRVSETKSKKINIDTGVKFSWAERELISSMQEIVGYETPQNIAAEVTVNEKTGKVNLNGNGDFSIELEELYNEIYIRYTLDNPNIFYVVCFEKIVDIIPPILRLPENKSAIRVDASEYVLAGVTEPNAVVHVGGEEVFINQDGTFTHKVSLKNGENIIPVTATDLAGNITAQDVIIIKSSSIAVAGTNDKGFWGNLLRFLPMLVSFVGSAVFIVLTFIFTKLYEKNKEISRSYAVFSLLRNVMLVFTVLSALATGYAGYKYFTINTVLNSEKLFEAASVSITDAFKLMEDLALYKEWLIKGILATLGMAALFTGCLFIARALKKRAAEYAAEQPVKQVVEQADGQATNQAVDSSTEQANRQATPKAIERAVEGEQLDHKDDMAQEDVEAALPTDSPIESESDKDSTDIEAIICPSCGASYDKPVKFCGKCGTKLN